MKSILKIASFGLAWAVIVAASSLQSCHAQEAEPAASEFKPEVWLNAGAFSRHFNRHAGFNEDNHGFGVEYRATENTAVIVGHYFNSVRRNTDYAGVLYQPLRVGPLRIGASVGAMNGYPNMSNGAAFFAAIPMVSWEGRRVGFNAGVIPSMGKVEGTLLFQIKARAF